MRPTDRSRTSEATAAKNLMKNRKNPLRKICAPFWIKKGAATALAIVKRWPAAKKDLEIQFSPPPAARRLRAESRRLRALRREICGSWMSQWLVSLAASALFMTFGTIGWWLFVGVVMRLLASKWPHATLDGAALWGIVCVSLATLATVRVFPQKSDEAWREALAGKAGIDKANAIKQAIGALQAAREAFEIHCAVRGARDGERKARKKTVVAEKRAPQIRSEPIDKAPPAKQGARRL